MNALRGRALENEFCEIARELDGDAEGRVKANAYLAATHASADGGPDAWALTPKVFCNAEMEILADATETMGRILTKVTQRYLTDPDFRALFGLSEDLERLSLVPTGYEQVLPIMRLDTLFNEETGDFTFCGVASDSPAGMTSAVDVTRAVCRTEAYRRFAERHHSIETFDLADGVVAAIRETYDSWANADAGSHHPDYPAVGIVDYPEDASPEEFADIIERMSEDGVFVRFVDIRDLRIEEAAGVRRLVDSEGPIACVYRRALTSSMADKPCAGATALVDAARFGLACVINGFGSWPVTTNRLFAILHSDAAESLLDAHELAFVRAHTPESYVLERGSDLTRFIAEKDRWVARPAGTYTLRDLVAGRDCSDPDDWWRVLLACAEEGGVVQAVDAPYVSQVIVGGTGHDSDEAVSAEPVSANNLTGLYLFRGKFGGVWARCGYKGPRGEWDNHLKMGCLIVGE